MSVVTQQQKLVLLWPLQEYSRSLRTDLRRSSSNVSGKHVLLPSDVGHEVVPVPEKTYIQCSQVVLTVPEKTYFPCHQVVLTVPEKTYIPCRQVVLTVPEKTYIPCCQVDQPDVSRHGSKHQVSLIILET